MVEAGLAVGVATVVLLKPAAGLQAKLPDPLPFNVAVGVIQVVVKSLPAFTDGGVLSTLTVVDEVA